jgi:PAS domain S-box-containing protein
MSFVVFGIGVVVLMGWLLDIPVLKSFHPRLFSMKANTAAGMALSGVALWLLQTKQAEHRFNRRFAQGCALVTTTVGLLTLLEYVFRANFGIDQLLFREPPGAVIAGYPGRMSPITALIFSLTGPAFLLLDVQTRRGICPAQFLILLGGAFALLGFFGCLYGAFVFFGNTFPFMVTSALTAVAFLALGAGMMAARPDRGLMTLITSKGPGGVIVRRLLLAVLVLPIAFDLLTMPGEKAGYYNSLTQAAMQGLMVIAAFTVIVYWVSRLLERAEEQLRELSRAVEQSPASIVITDLRGNIEYVNPKFTDLTGYTLAEAIGQNPRILKSGELSPDAYRRLWETITSGREWQGEFHNRKKNGEFYWEFASISPVLDDAGRITHFLAVKEDITARKRMEILLVGRAELAEVAQRASLDELLQLALDKAELLTGSCIGFFHFVDADQQNLSLQTWSTNTLKRMCTAEGRGRHYPVDQAGVWVDCLRTRAPVIHNDYASLPHKKGLPPGHATVVRELVVPIIRDGLVVAILGVGNKATDYTADDAKLVEQLAEVVADDALRQQAQAALRESEERFRTVTYTASDAIITVDHVSRIRFWNPAAEDIFGHSVAEAMGQPLDLIIPERFRQAHQAGMDRMLATGESKMVGKTIELTGRRKDGQEFPLELSLSHWKTEKGDFFTGIIRDVSDRKKAEAERERLLKSLEESLASIKTLSGLIPICASCKKVRDDKGYWSQVETYVAKHSEATFSHGICPACAHKLYPELYPDPPPP